MHSCNAICEQAYNRSVYGAPFAIISQSPVTRHTRNDVAPITVYNCLRLDGGTDIYRLYASRYHTVVERWMVQPVDMATAAPRITHHWLIRAYGSDQSVASPPDGAAAAARARGVFTFRSPQLQARPNENKSLNNSLRAAKKLNTYEDVNSIRIIDNIDNTGILVIRDLQ